MKVKNALAVGLFLLSILASQAACGRPAGQFSSGEDVTNQVEIIRNSQELIDHRTGDGN